jgi:hypothetical protein
MKKKAKKEKVEKVENAVEQFPLSVLYERFHQVTALREQYQAQEQQCLQELRSIHKEIVRLSQPKPPNDD